MTPPMIIAGFHRSGTSAVSRLLHLAGVFLGDDLLGARRSNPYGHFEDREVVHLHRDILDVNGSSWLEHEPTETVVPDDTWRVLEEFVRKRNASGKPWGFKDPRVCLFMPLWEHMLPNANVVVVYRSPAEAVRSLHARHSYQLSRREGRSDLHKKFWEVDDLGVRMWLHYHERLLATLPDLARVHAVHFGDRDAIAELVPTLNNRWSINLDPENHNAIDPKLGRAALEPLRVVDHSLIEEVGKMWSRLRELEATTSGSTE